MTNESFEALEQIQKSTVLLTVTKLLDKFVEQIDNGALDYNAPVSLGFLCSTFVKAQHELLKELGCSNTSGKEVEDDKS